MVGTSLGNYKILQLLGAGGMGEVYLAQHRRLARKTAVKVLRPELSASPGLVERFFTEARAASLIRHRGIVEILDCDVHEGCAFIVMEYLEGESLAGYLRRVGPLGGDLPSAIMITRQITQAVGAAHAAGIVHRDLKPDNVFLAVSQDAENPVVVKILDFGIAKLLGGANEGTGGASLTRTGNLLGTPLYMSPEQCRGIAQIDSRADVYALGCIFFEMLTGRPPFVRENAGDLLVCHITETPPAPSLLVPSVPPELDGLVLRMLAKSPDDRPSGMHEIDAALASFSGFGRALGSGHQTVMLSSPLSPVVHPTPAVATPYSSPRARTPLPPPALQKPQAGTDTTFRNATGERAGGASLFGDHVVRSPSRKPALIAGGVVAGILAVALIGWQLADKSDGDKTTRAQQPVPSDGIGPRGSATSLRDLPPVREGAKPPVAATGTTPGKGEADDSEVAPPRFDPPPGGGDLREVKVDPKPPEPAVNSGNVVKVRPNPGKTKPGKGGKTAATGRTDRPARDELEETTKDDQKVDRPKKGRDAIIDL